MYPEDKNTLRHAHPRHVFHGIGHSLESSCWKSWKQRAFVWMGQSKMHEADDVTQFIMDHPMGMKSCPSFHEERIDILLSERERRRQDGSVDYRGAATEERASWETANGGAERIVQFWVGKTHYGVHPKPGLRKWDWSGL